MASLIATIIGIIYALVGIGYYLGCALITAPSAHRGAKEAGWEMIRDSSTAVVVMAIAFFFMAIVDVVFRAVFRAPIGENAAGIAYSKLTSWLEGEKWGMFWAALKIEALPILLDAIDALLPTGGGFLDLIASFLRTAYMPWRILVASYTTALALVDYWANFLYSGYWILFLMFGALIYSIPKRIGRSAGAWLFAIGATYYIMLPFMPFFIDGLAGTITESLMQFPDKPPEDIISARILLMGLYDYNTMLLLRFVLFLLYQLFIVSATLTIARTMGATESPLLTGGLG
jgi:hypothetical protein